MIRTVLLSVALCAAAPSARWRMAATGTSGETGDNPFRARNYLVYPVSGRFCSGP